MVVKKSLYVSRTDFFFRVFLAKLQIEKKKALLKVISDKFIFLL